jgi:hypothetical protein
MSRQELLAELLAMPDRLENGERSLFEIEAKAQAAREALADREAETLLGLREDGTPLLAGKNAEVRGAELRLLTATEREALGEVERELTGAKLVLRCEQNRFAALRSAVRLLAAESGGEP